MLRNASAMIAEREALRMGIEHLTVLFPTEVSSFDFQVECIDRTVQYKLNAQSLRLFGLHRDVNDAHRAGANRLQNKTNKKASSGDCKHVGWSLCVNGSFRDVVDEEGAVMSIPGYEGRIAEAWVDVRGGMLFFGRVFVALRRIDAEMRR